MLGDKIRTILATETSDMLKINRLTKDLEALFVQELYEATVGAVNRLYENKDDDNKGG
uniref:Uncharacterized protein n=1 Tax=viral metagenome TaxID=1070528 RepID=A0A6M3X6F7_9ZZZZ